MKQNYFTLTKIIFLVLVTTLATRVNSQCNITNTVDTWSFPNNYSLGQSFTASCDGNLEYVEIETINSSGNITGTFEVFSGDGFSGSLIYSEAYNLNGTTKITLSNPLTLVSGQVYTFAYSSVGSLGPEYHNSNAYSGGKAYSSGSVIGSGEYDWAFDISIFNDPWTQVGNAQFTNFTTNVAMDCHPTTGQPYVVYDDLTDGNKAYAKMYDGTNWVDVGGAISTVGTDNHAIKFHPITNEPWIAYRKTNNSKMSAKRFDGVNWVDVIAELPHTIEDRQIEIQFNSSGDAQILNFSSQTVPRLCYITNGANTYNYYYAILSSVTYMNLIADFVEYNKMSWTWQGINNSIYSKDQLQINNPIQYNHNASSNSDVYQGVEAIPEENIFIINNRPTSGGTVNFILRESTSSTNAVTLSAPINTVNNKGFQEFKKSINGKYYLTYADSNDNLQLERYTRSANLWNATSSTNISTSNANFFVDMDANPVTGDIYVAYFDGGKLSVKKYEVEQLLPRYYVNANVSGGDGSGDSWANAMPDLHTALTAAHGSPTTTEIWIAKGTYKPHTSDRDIRFIIYTNSNISVYGGFDGTETNLSDRDISKVHTDNATILSGDLNGNDDNNIGFTNGTKTDNSYRVLMVGSNNVTLDGLTIANGYANGSTGEFRYGAGIKVTDNVVDFTIKNCIIKNNLAQWGAGISYTPTASTTFIIDACIFDTNVATGAAAYYTYAKGGNSTIQVSNSLFNSNITIDKSTSVLGYGGSAGWIRAYTSGSTTNAIITNNTFVNNINDGSKTGTDFPTLAISKNSGSYGTLTIANNIFWSNYFQAGSTTVGNAIGKATGANSPTVLTVFNSIDQNNFSNLTYLTNTSNANPLFSDAANGDFTLTTGSPAIDTGDNTKIPSSITADLLFNQRIHNTTVDMGAYEFGASSVLSSEEVVLEKNVKVYPNPVGNMLYITSEQKLDKLEIYSLLGQKVLTTESKKINVSSLSQGMYLLKIYHQNGSVTTKKFVKE